MGVDYSPVSGYGLEITDDMKELLMRSQKIDCIEDLMEWIDLPYDIAGDGLAGEEYAYVFVWGNTPEELIENTPLFLNSLKMKGINVKKSDLSFVEDMYIS